MAVRIVCMGENSSPLVVSRLVPSQVRDHPLFESIFAKSGNNAVGQVRFVTADRITDIMSLPKHLPCDDIIGQAGCPDQPAFTHARAMLADYLRLHFHLADTRGKTTLAPATSDIDASPDDLPAHVEASMLAKYRWLIDDLVTRVIANERMRLSSYTLNSLNPRGRADIGASARQIDKSVMPCRIRRRRRDTGAFAVATRALAEFRKTVVPRIGALGGTSVTLSALRSAARRGGDRLRLVFADADDDLGCRALSRRSRETVMRSTDGDVIWQDILELLSVTSTMPGPSDSGLVADGVLVRPEIVYQRFVGEHLRRLFGHCESGSSAGYRLGLGESLSVSRKSVPDFIVRSPMNGLSRSITLVADAKWKMIRDGRIGDADILKLKRDQEIRGADSAALIFQDCGPMLSGRLAELPSSGEGGEPGYRTGAQMLSGGIVRWPNKSVLSALSEADEEHYFSLSVAQVAIPA